MSKTAPTTEPLKSQRDIEDGDAEKTCRDNDEDEEDAKKTKKKKVKLSKKQKILVGLFVVLFLVCLILSGLCIYMLIANISVMELAS
ncbi:hypothetical protein L596_021686 [Steinernema carpocapsae]|uniref:Transglycosylase PBP1b N-terminal transmembrane domain-containing protein n=1 Tax=Steinernema carpocapsae TaxID=34508 RepID=A0A4U5MJL0_STECR|nr:hypothetical protein L596_021686 [Steinernema carpocapsae]